MVAPATNATITQVSGPGSIDRYGDVASSETLWSGNIRGYLRRPRKSRTGMDREEDLKLDEFVIHGEAASPILQSLSAGAEAESVTVTIRDDRRPLSSVSTYKIKGLDIMSAGTVADSVRLMLRREVAA